MIVVTAPTGNIGQHVVRHLLDAGEALRVIARDPARLPQEMRDRAEVVAGSHGDAAVIGRALEGAEAVFWLCPPVPAATPATATPATATPAAATVDFTRPGDAAMRRHGTRRVAAATTLERGTGWQDEAGRDRVDPHGRPAADDGRRGVRPRAAGHGQHAPAGRRDPAGPDVWPIRQGRMSGPVDPDRKLPRTATRDTGAAAARLLRDRTWTGQQDVPVLGPEELSCGDRRGDRRESRRGGRRPQGPLPPDPVRRPQG